MTVVVTMKTPWVAFPAYLWSSGRVGIAAPAQLNDTSAELQHAHDRHRPVQGDEVRRRRPVTSPPIKNPDYWRKGFPYLDGLNFKIQESGDQRVNGLQGGQFDIIHDDNGVNYDTVKGFGSGFSTLLEPPGRRELGQALLNVTRPPLNDLNIRKAIAEGTDRNALNEIANKGNFPLADQVIRQRRDGLREEPPGSRSTTRRDAKKLVNA